MLPVMLREQASVAERCDAQIRLNYKLQQEDIAEKVAKAAIPNTDRFYGELLSNVDEIEWNTSTVRGISEDSVWNQDRVNRKAGGTYRVNELARRALGVGANTVCLRQDHNLIEFITTLEGHTDKKTVDEVSSRDMNANPNFITSSYIKKLPRAEKLPRAKKRITCNVKWIFEDTIKSVGDSAHLVHLDGFELSALFRAEDDRVQNKWEQLITGLDIFQVHGAVCTCEHTRDGTHYRQYNLFRGLEKPDGINLCRSVTSLIKRSQCRRQRSAYSGNAMFLAMK
jgi:hypothetical protein